MWLSFNYLGGFDCPSVLFASLDVDRLVGGNGGGRYGFGKEDFCSVALVLDFRSLVSLG